MITVGPDEICTPYEAARLYRVASMHFREDVAYNAFRYNFNGLHIKETTYRTDRNKYVYERLSKQYSRKRAVIGYYLANILDGNSYISQMTGASEVRWCGRVQSMNYTIKKALAAAADICDSFDHMLQPDLRSAGAPIIFDTKFSEIFNIEHLVILDSLTGFTKHINTSCGDPLGISRSRIHTIQAYTPFIHSLIQIKNCKSAVINEFTKCE